MLDHCVALLVLLVLLSPSITVVHGLVWALRKIAV